MNITLLASEIVCRVKDSPDSAANLEILVAGLIREELGRAKKRVVFKFDERSLETREDFEAMAKAEGWQLTEVKTPAGTILIPTHLAK